jgi:flagellar protein FliO/FliZ
MLLAQTSRIDSAAQFATVLLAFVFVLALTLVGTRLVGNFQKKQLRTGNFEALEGFRLANNKYLQLVRIGKRYYVLAIGKDEIGVVTEVDREELEFSDENGVPGTGFGKILISAKDRLGNKGGRADEES